jgi:hypothetical protein
MAEGRDQAFAGPGRGAARGFPEAWARLRSNRFEVTVKRQKRRLFLKERLPETVLADPRYWEERHSEVVTCHEIATFRAGDPDIVLIE